MRPVAASLVAVAALASSTPANAAIYGVDDRRQVYEETDELWRGIAQQSVMMKLRAGWGICDGSTVMPTETLGERMNLCEGEAFIDEPVLASCSATLVDSDLVAIARHCVLEDDDCATATLVPGAYWAAPEELRSPRPTDVYACRQVVAHVPGVDIAFVQLDRPVVGMTPARLGPTPLMNSPVTVIGFPTGTPMKIARECVALDENNAAHVHHDCDTFLGNSGSGVFAEDGTLWGVHVAGPGGDYDLEGDCQIAKLYTQDGHIPGIPSAPQLGGAAKISDVLPTLCDRGWPTALCGTEPACGDGFCSGPETAKTCAADCTEAACGDDVCEILEELECEDCAHLVEVCDQGGTSTGTTLGGSESGGSESGLDDGAVQSSEQGGDTRGNATSGIESSGSVPSDGDTAQADGCGCAATHDASPLAPWVFFVCGLLGRHRARRRCPPRRPRG